jgi:hypothetical protein
MNNPKPEANGAEPPTAVSSSELVVPLARLQKLHDEWIRIANAMQLIDGKDDRAHKAIRGCIGELYQVMNPEQ